MKFPLTHPYHRQVCFPHATGGFLSSSFCFLMVCRGVCGKERKGTIRAMGEDDSGLGYTTKPWAFCLGHLSAWLSPRLPPHRTRRDFKSPLVQPPRFIDEALRSTGNLPRASHLFGGRLRTRNQIFWHLPLVPFTLLFHAPADIERVALAAHFHSYLLTIGSICSIPII